MDNSNSYIIALGNVPAKWTIKQLVQKITPILNHRFSALCFASVKGGMKKNKFAPKTAFLRFPCEIEPRLVLAKLQDLHVYVQNTNYTMSAFIPKEIPHDVLRAKGKGINRKQAQKLRIMTDDPPVIFTQTLYEVLRELQTTYMGLYDLSATFKHQLLRDIAHFIFERFTEAAGPQMMELDYYSLSKAFRGIHPHSKDFALIKSALHKIEAKMGQPLTTITKEELLRVPTADDRSNDPLYIQKILHTMATLFPPIQNKVVDHIINLPSIDIPQPTEEQCAVMEVREHLRRQACYVAEIMRDTIIQDVMPKRGRGDIIRCKIYGWPYLPNRDVLSPAINHVAASARPRRCRRLFNCLLLDVHSCLYPQFLKLNGTNVGGATLVCRPSTVPMHGIPKTVLERIRSFYGLASNPEQPTQQAENEGDEEDGDIDFDEIDADVEGSAVY